MEDQDERMTQNSYNNIDHSDPTFIKLRLDTSNLVKDIKHLLSATETIILKNSEGDMYEQENTVGIPVANKSGVYAIVNMVNMKVNNHNFQGNIDRDQYNHYLELCRKELCEQIILNCYEWGIEDSKINYIVDNIMSLITIAMTRPIMNKERESFNNQFNTREVVNSGKKGLSSFTGGIGN